MPNKLRKPLREDEFYCVYCHQRVKGKDICVTTFNNPRSKMSVPTMTGYCSKCQGRLNKFVKQSDKVKLARKYGRC